MFNTKGFVIAVAANVCLASQALAFDPEVFPHRLKQQLNSWGVDITWQDVSGDADELLLDNVTITSKQDRTSTDLPIDFIFRDIKLNSDGSYTIGEFTTPLCYDPAAIAALPGPTDIPPDLKLGGCSFANFKIPANPKSKNLFDYFELPVSIKFGEFGASAPNEEGRVDFGGLEFSISEQDDGSFKTLLFLEDLFLDMSGVPDQDEELIEILETIGYKLNLTYRYDIDWSPKLGTLGATEQYRVKDLANFTQTIELGGISQNFVDRVLNLAIMGIENPDFIKDDEQKYAFQMMGMMAEISFSKFAWHYEDASLAKKLFDKAESENGITRDQIIDRLRIGLAEVKREAPPPFQDLPLWDEAETSIIKFINEPKDLVLSIDPGREVYFSEIAGYAYSAPHLLVDVLKPMIIVNQE